MKKTVGTKIAALLLAALLSLTTLAPALAETLPDVSNSTALTQDTGLAEPGKVELRASIASSFLVTLPKTVTLTKDTPGSGEYKASFVDTVSGDIGGNELLSVVPDGSITLSSEKANAVVAAPIVLGTTEFRRDAVLSGSSATHNVTATLSPGAWTGTMNVLIKLGMIAAVDNFSVAPGLYQTGTSEFATMNVNGNTVDATWDNLKAAGYVKVDSGTFSAAEGTSTNIATGVVRVLSAFNTTAFAAGDTALTGDLVLPRDGTVTKIADSAFETANLDITGIQIPASVTAIGANAFATTTGVQTVRYKSTTSNWAKISLASAWQTNIVADAVTCDDGDVLLKCMKYRTKDYEYSLGQAWNGSVWVDDADTANDWGVRALSDVKEVFAQPYKTLDGRPVTNFSGMFKNSKATTIDLSGWDMSAVKKAADMFKGNNTVTTIKTPKNTKIGIALEGSFTKTGDSGTAYSMLPLNSEQSISITRVYVDPPVAGEVFREGIYEYKYKAYFSTSASEPWWHSIAVEGWGVHRIATPASGTVPAPRTEIKGKPVKWADGLLSGLTFTTMDLSAWDVHNLVSFSDMFADCRNLKSVNLSNWDTSNASNFYGMFYGCQMLTSLDVSSFDTRNAVSMQYMFYGCSSLKSLDLRNFVSAAGDVNDSTKKVYTNNMMTKCPALKTVIFSKTGWVFAKTFSGDMWRNEAVTTVIQV